MKKLSIFLIVTTMLFSMTACGDAPEESTAPTAEEASVATLEATTKEAQVANEPEGTDEVVVYTSASATEYELIVNLFKEKYPDITVEIVSGGSGEMAARINAEKNSPYGDIMMGGGVTTYNGIADLLERYETVNKADLFPEFVSEDGLYTPCYINVNSIIINKTLIAETGVTVDSWESLTDERLKGNISYASPADSSSAMEQMINMLTAMSATGEPMDGWEFVQKYLINLDGKVAAGSSAAYKNVVSGEYAVGLTNEDKVISYMKDGADVTVAYPKEGITLRTSNIAIIKDGKNLLNARLFVDFVTSKECQIAMESEVNVRPSRKDVELTTEGRLPTAELVSIPYPTVTSEEIKSKFQDVWTSLD